MALVESSERTSVRCDLQLEGLREDVLDGLVDEKHETITGHGNDIRCEDLGLFMDIERGEPLRKEIPRMKGSVSPANIPQFDLSIKAIKT